MLHFGMNMPLIYMALYGSVMIVVVLILRALLKNKLPGFVFPILWAAVLVRLLVPFSISSPISLPVPSGPLLAVRLFGQLSVREKESLTENEATALFEDAVSASGTAGDAGGTMLASHADEYTVVEEGPAVVGGSGAAYTGDVFLYGSFFPGRVVLPVLYLLGLAAAAGLLGWQRYRCAGKLKGGLLLEHNETINAMLREMDMGHVLVFTSDRIASPLVSRLLNPRIYLPTRMDFGNTTLLRHVLAHEIMHIRRRDNWLKCVMVAALVIHWYNPLVWIMSKCLASDMEAACDAALLGQWDEEERKNYAFSLLAMAVTGNRTTLLYSAFSRTEVERRVKGILHYKKATAFVLALAVLFTFGSTAVFATGGQAPFSTHLTAYCYSSNCRWGGYASITRDIALGENAQERAEEAVISVLRADTTGDPEILETQIKEALAAEFGVERKAFEAELSLCLGPEEIEEEYAAFGLAKGEDGFWRCQGEQIRTFEDKMLGSYQSREEGVIDISVERDRLGKVTSVTVWRAGDQEYDERTERLEQQKMRGYGTETAGGM